MLFCNADEFPSLRVPALTVVSPLKVFAAFNDRLPAPLFVNAPEPLITPVRVSVVAAVSIWKAPVPPAAKINCLLLVAVAPVYSNVPVVPDPPKVTPVALFPRGPFVLELLTVATLIVPAWIESCPVKVFVPERTKVLVPVLVTAFEPLITPLSVTRPVPLPVNVSVLLPANGFEIVKAPVLSWLIELPETVNEFPAMVSVALEVLLRDTEPNVYEVMSFVDV